MGVGGKWVDRDSDPVVRPYALTGGRTEPADGEVLDLIAVIVDTGRRLSPPPSSRSVPSTGRS